MRALTTLSLALLTSLLGPSMARAETVPGVAWRAARVGDVIRRRSTIRFRIRERGAEAPGPTRAARSELTLTTLAVADGLPTEALVEVAVTDMTPWLSDRAFVLRWDGEAVQVTDLAGQALYPEVAEQLRKLAADSVGPAAQGALGALPAGPLEVGARYEVPEPLLRRLIATSEPVTELSGTLQVLGERVVAGELLLALEQRTRLRVEDDTGRQRREYVSELLVNPLTGRPHRIAMEAALAVLGPEEDEPLREILASFESEAEFESDPAGRAEARVAEGRGARAAGLWVEVGEAAAAPDAGKLKVDLNETFTTLGGGLPKPAIKRHWRSCELILLRRESAWTGWIEKALVSDGDAPRHLPWEFQRFLVPLKGPAVPEAVGEEPLDAALAAAIAPQLAALRARLSAGGRSRLLPPRALRVGETLRPPPERTRDLIPGLRPGSRLTLRVVGAREDRLTLEFRVEATDLEASPPAELVLARGHGLITLGLSDGQLRSAELRLIFQDAPGEGDRPVQTQAVRRLTLTYLEP